MNTTVNRRSFIQGAVGASTLAALRATGQTATPSASKPLRVAVIGCGVQGCHVLLPAACKERVAALVDPDAAQIQNAFKRIRKVSPETDTSTIRTFSDYRQLFDVMSKELDAVMIATPNHQHALPALLAIRRGLHVYVEKPMTHTLAEARQLTEEARKAGVATQLGNQGQSSEGSRLLCEYVAADAIGPIREVYCWSNRANGFPAEYVRPPVTPIPQGLAWDTWIGPAPFRDYHANLHPHTWHSWRDFGNGSLGNMGCHIMNHPYWALKLGSPSAVEVEELHCEHPECWPVGTRIRWEFPARADMPPVKVYWYDGLAKGTPYSKETVEQRWRHVVDSARNFPPIREELKKKHGPVLPDEGSLLVGDKGLMTIDKHGEGFRMIPEEAHRAFPRPAKTLPRVKGTHQADFFRACRGGAPACSNFNHSGPLAEIVLLGNLAILAGRGRRIEWDGPALRCTNLPELNRHVKIESRAGWSC
jgi:predicted dehydrogenase